MNLFSKSENKLVALASIAAELDTIKNIAWGVSIAAKNAKIMSVQAGEKGRGFQPITKFIDEISQQVMTGINDITAAALKLSKMAVNEQRSIDAFNRFVQVQNKNNKTRYIKSLSPAMKKVEETMLPGLNKAIEVKEIGTPLTNIRYTSNTRGAIYGWDQTLNNSGNRRFPNKTPVKNLYLAGAWTSPGHGYGGVIPSGLQCFGEIMKNW